MKRLSISALSFSALISLNNYAATNISGDQIDLYLRACSTGLTNNGGAKVEVSLLKNKLLGVEMGASGEYTTSQIATAIKSMESDTGRNEALKAIQECMFRMITTMSSDNAIPKDIQQNFLTVISEIKHFRTLADDAIESLPDRVVVSNEEYFPKKDPIAKSLQSWERYGAFFDQATGDLSINFVSKENIRALCDVFQSDVSDFNRFDRKLRTSLKRELRRFPEYAIPKGIMKICYG